MWEDGSAVGLLTARERGDSGAAARVRRRLAVTRALVDRLGLEAELHGHDGCVNCLEWSADGEVLASASDDLRVILWDPFRRRKLCDIASGHIGNIFSVKFVSAGRLATGAGDCAVRVRDASAADAPQLVCVCHRARVKRLAVHPLHSDIIWSAGEDGLVLRHDLRSPHACGASRNVVVNLRWHAGRFAEAKCVAVSPARPHQLAVGANDCYVRLYDTRMIKLAGWREGGETAVDGVTCAAASYFAPGHLSTEASAPSFPKLAATYVAFSADGNQLLVNLGSEQVYVFDVYAAPRPLQLESYLAQQEREQESDSVPAAPTLPPHVVAIKEAANECVRASQLGEAVALYGEALGAAGGRGSAACSAAGAALLLSNRATALLRRGWAGDAYAAARDCRDAVRLHPAHLKSHFRLAKALLELRRAREAKAVLDHFRRRFPAHADSHAVRLLARDVAAARAPEGECGECGEGVAGGGGGGTSRAESELRAAAGDYSQRFVGHCNVTTDIKEASFLGAGYVAAGSDDGGLLVWSRASGRLVRALRADDSILNCVQPHPAACLLATSGIESVVRLWSPRPADAAPDARAAPHPADVATANQLRMRADPFESMLLNVSGPRDLHALPCCPS